MSNKTDKYIDEFIEETETLKTRSIHAENNDSNDKEAGVRADRDSKGRWKKGCKSPNPGGRPSNAESIVQSFRDDPKGLDVVNRLIEVASTFGTDNQHRDAVSAVKLVIERLVPSLKSSEVQVTSDDKGFVFMPEQTKARTEEDTDSDS